MVEPLYAEGHEGQLFHVTFVLAGLCLTHGPCWWSEAVTRSHELQDVAGVTDVAIVDSFDLEVR